MQKLLLIFLLFSFTTYGQTDGGKIKPNIQNSVTSEHINIPATRLYIIPPPNFNVAAAFVGLQKGEESMFVVQELVGGNFYTNAATFSKGEFERNGATVYDYQEIQVNGYPAKYISMQTGPMLKGLALVFGDTTFSILIMIRSTRTDEQTEKEIIEALNTIHYDKDKNTDPFENAFFTLDDKKSKFKFCRSMAGIFMYTIGGTENTKGTDNPFVLVTVIPRDNATTEDIAATMISKQEQHGFMKTQVKNSSVNKIDGYDTYEVEVYGQMQGTNTLIYQYIVAKGDKVVCIQGIARSDMEKNVKDFKELAHTILIK